MSEKPPSTEDQLQQDKIRIVKVIHNMDSLGLSYYEAVLAVLKGERIKGRLDVAGVMSRLSSLEGPARRKLEQEKLAALVARLEEEERIAIKKHADENSAALARRDSELPDED